MFKCEYCDKELRSNAGKAAHERRCKARDIGGQTEEEIVDNTEKVVQLQVLGSGGHYSDGQDNNYYEGHPRREIKLRGLLSRTRDTKERSKLMKMIIELRKG